MFHKIKIGLFSYKSFTYSHELVKLSKMLNQIIEQKLETY